MHTLDKTVAIVGITREIKNLVKQHGKMWNIYKINPAVKVDDGKVIIETTVMVHNGGTQPYACWAKEGIDFKTE